MKPQTKLRSCNPPGNATAQPAATDNATGAQPTSLKALAAGVIARNNERNSVATDSKTGATGAQLASCNAELRRLVNLVADFHAFTPEDRAEALEIALSDPANALICFRALVQEIPR